MTAKTTTTTTIMNRIISLLSLSTTLFQVVQCNTDGPGFDEGNFNYCCDGFSRDGDWGPENWNKVGCDVDDPDKCGPDAWLMANNWQINKDDLLYSDAQEKMEDRDDYIYEGNRCMWCPVESLDGDGNANLDTCSDPLNGGGHHMGPVMLERERGYPDQENNAFICKDTHWMKYWEGSCDWNDITNNPETEFKNNFFIRRHGLHIYQPHDEDGNLKCPSGNQYYTPMPLNETDTLPKENAYPKLDYSKGFPDWWYLSHMEIKTPSEFYQNGASYDGEIRYYHFYSEPYRGETPYRKIGVVSIFFETADNVQPDPFMDKLICQFRKTEEENRKECGLPSVSTHYPGCMNYNTPEDTTRLRRHLRGEGAGSRKEPKEPPKLREPMEIFPDMNKYVLDEDNDANYEEPYDFDEWVDEEILKGTHNDPGPNYPYKHGRHLTNYEHVPWFSYQFMQNVQTEYYFRLQASLTVPPCTTETHWRVMKDPLRLHPRQVPEIQRLIAHRIAPLGSKYRQCQRDTAGVCEKKSDGEDQQGEDQQGEDQSVDDVCDVVNVARPLQYKVERHRDRFCHCQDWWSKFRGDRKWCEIEDIDERFFQKPYNWQTEFYEPTTDKRTLDKTLNEDDWK